MSYKHILLSSLLILAASPVLADSGIGAALLNSATAVEDATKNSAQSVVDSKVNAVESKANAEAAKAEAKVTPKTPRVEQENIQKSVDNLDLFQGDHN